MINTIKFTKIYFLIWGILLFTPMRGGLLLIMPLLIFFFNKIFLLTCNKFLFKGLMCISVISSIISMLKGWSEPANAIMNYWLFTPILYLFLSAPIKPNLHINFNKAFKYLLIVIYTVDILGYIGLIAGASGFAVWGYGKYYEEAHGLALINLMFLFYFVAKIMHKEYSKKTIFHFTFFLIAFYMCNFGMGWIFLFLTIITFLLLQIKPKYIFAILFIVMIGYQLYNSEEFSYIKHNVEVTKAKDKDNARKAIMFTKIPYYLQENTYIPLIGCGPGAYSSRQTILICSSSNNPFTKLLGHHDPKFYKKYIYPLWNSTFVSMASYTDGTKNKPFSTFVSIMAETGILFVLLIFIFWFRKILKFKCERKHNYLYTYLLFINIFFFIACIGHEWMICTEFITFLLLNFLVLNECQKRKVIKQLRNKIE